MAEITVDITDGYDNRDGGAAQITQPDAPNRDTHEWNVNVTWPCKRCGAAPDLHTYPVCPGGEFLDDNGVVLT